MELKQKYIKVLVFEQKSFMIFKAFKLIVTGSSLCRIKLIKSLYNMSK